MGLRLGASADSQPEVVAEAISGVGWESWGAAEAQPQWHLLGFPGNEECFKLTDTLFVGEPGCWRGPAMPPPSSGSLPALSQVSESTAHASPFSFQTKDEHWIRSQWVLIQELTHDLDSGPVKWAQVLTNLQGLSRDQKLEDYRRKLLETF